MRGSTIVLTALLGTAALAAPKAAPKAPPPKTPQDQRSFILRIDGRDTYFDLGREAGAAPGEKVKVFRMVSALHPATQRMVHDLFLIGEMEVAEAGATMSRSRPGPELASLLQVGDVVELANPRRPAPPPLILSEAPEAPSRRAAPLPAAVSSLVQPSAEPSAPVLVRLADAPLAPCPEPVAAAPAAPSPEELEGLSFRATWLHAQQFDSASRASLWEAWVKEHPGSPLAAPLRKEAAALREAPRRELVRGAAANVVASSTTNIPLQLRAPAKAFEGDPLEMVLAVQNGADAGGFKEALLYWRPTGEREYRVPSQRFGREGEYLRARLPEEASRAPGVEYYIEVVEESGTRPLHGDGQRPAAIEIRKMPGTGVASKDDRSRTGLWVDYVDWNQGKGNDFHITVEGEFLYRVQKGLHSLRMGFGFYQGKGQTLKEAIEDETAADLAKQPVKYRTRDVGYNYGFTELEFQPHEYFGFSAKLLTGVNKDGFGVGGAGRIRIGRDNGTHLALAAGLTKGLGNRNEITLAWDRVEGWPMAGTVIVTNEPVGADYGVRLLYSLGRSVFDWMDVSLRLSYQLRDINHNGFGAGLATSFHW